MKRVFVWTAVLISLVGRSESDGRQNVFSVTNVAGVPRLAVNGKPMSGTAVLPSPRVSPGASVDALKKFDAAGIRFFSDVWTMRRPQPVRQWWLDEGRYDFALFDRLVRGMLCATPTGLVIPRIKLEPPDAWIATKFHHGISTVTLKKRCNAFVGHSHAAPSSNASLPQTL